jgi:hypothetical protein
MRGSLTAVLAFLLTALAVSAQGATTEVDDALTVFRDDRVIVEYSDLGQARLEMAIAALKDALSVPEGLDESSEGAVSSFPVDPVQEDLVIQLSQCYFTLGVIFLQGEDDEADAYLKGKHWGLKSLRMHPEFAATEKSHGFVDAVKTSTDAVGLYWAALNWLSIANFDPLGVVTGGVAKKTVAMLERVIELDSAYDCYGAYRVLGSVWGALPRLPFGTYRKNLERARTLLCHVVDSDLCGDLGLDPVDPTCTEYLGNRRVFAEYYLMEKGLWADAAQVLQSVIDAPIGEAYPLYNACAQNDARRLLEEVNKHL